MAKVLVSLDEGLLARIDRAAEEAGLSRSAYLSRVVSKELGAATGPGRDGGVRSALDRLDRLFRVECAPEGATEAVRAERDAR